MFVNGQGPSFSLFVGFAIGSWNAKPGRCVARRQTIAEANFKDNHIDAVGRDGFVVVDYFRHTGEVEFGVEFHLFAGC